MRAHLGLALALMLAVAAGLTYARLQQRERLRPPAGRPGPAFVLPSLRGGDGDLSELPRQGRRPQLLGDLVPPLRRGDAVPRAASPWRGTDVAVVTISVDRDDQDLEAFVGTARLTLPVLSDPEERVSGEYRVTGYPETFIIDPDGTSRDHVIGGADWATPEAVRHIRSYAKH